MRGKHSLYWHSVELKILNTAGYPSKHYRWFSCLGWRSRISMVRWAGFSNQWWRSWNSDFWWENCKYFNLWCQFYNPYICNQAYDPANRPDHLYVKRCLACLNNFSLSLFVYLYVFMYAYISCSKRAGPNYDKYKTLTKPNPYFILAHSNLITI